MIRAEIFTSPTPAAVATGWAFTAFLPQYEKFFSTARFLPDDLAEFLSWYRCIHPMARMGYGEIMGHRPESISGMTAMRHDAPSPGTSRLRNRTIMLTFMWAGPLPEM
jgi:hypothetical protein